MTTPSVCGGAPAWLRALAAARTHYEEMFGWPVAIEVGQRVLAAPVGGVLDAITIPAPLGDKLLAELQLMMLDGPVITAPDDDWWMFFTQPVTGAGREVPVELRYLQVELMPAGTHVVIPTGIDSDRGLRWVKEPRPHRPLPPWSVVIGTTRRLVAKLISNESAEGAVAHAVEARRVLIAS